MNTILLFQTIEPKIKQKQDEKEQRQKKRNELLVTRK